MASPKRKANRATQSAPLHEPPQGAIVLPIPVTAAPPAHDRDPRAIADRIGNILKRERERRGDDLQQIADYLCIRRSFLVALESSHYEEFPADAYVIGFLRSYAEYLGLDGKETIDYYRREMAGRRHKPNLMMPTPISEGRAPSAIILAVAALAALLIYAVWYGISTADRAAVSAPPASPQASTSEPGTTQHSDTTATTSASDAVPSQPTPVPTTPPAAFVQATSTPSSPQATMPVAPPSTPVTAHEDIVLPAPSSTSGASVAPASAVPLATAAPSRLIIKAEQSSWVLVTDARGHTVFDHVMKPGEVYSVPDQKGLTLTTGNGAGILMTLDGSDLPKLSAAQGHIMRNIALDPTALKTVAAPTSND